MTQPQQQPPAPEHPWLRQYLLFAALAIVVVLAAAVLALAFNVTQAPVTPVTPAQAPALKAILQAPSTPAATKAQASLPCPPPPGEGAMGACTPKPVQVFGGSASPKVVPVGVDPPASIPDVSSWQGLVDWSAVKGWQVAHHFTPAGIFKMGEYVLDPYAARNNSELERLGMWRSGYWFLRNTGCGHEASQIIGEAQFLHLSFVILDDEVPEARGYDGCLTPTLRSAGLSVGEYASPGAYPGGSRSSNAAWIAAYGPANPPAAPWGGPIKAFQCTDGIFGCVTSVPGIGRIDMSVDYGITKLGGSAAPPPPQHYYSRFLGHWKSPWGTLNEQAIVRWYDAHRAAWRTYHAALVNSRIKQTYMANQLAWRIHHARAPADNSTNFRTQRFAELESRGLYAATCPSWAACINPSKFHR